MASIGKSGNSLTCSNPNWQTSCASLFSSGKCSGLSPENLRPILNQHVEPRESLLANLFALGFPCSWKNNALLLSNLSSSNEIPFFFASSSNLKMFSFILQNCTGSASSISTQFSCSVRPKNSSALVNCPVLFPVLAAPAREFWKSQKVEREERRRLLVANITTSTLNLKGKITSQHNYFVCHEIKINEI
jgi:hypothetical protein